MVAHYRRTIEELGGMMSVSIDVELSADFHEAEKQTHYYPGYPANADIWGVSAIAISGDGYRFELADRPDWRADVERIARAWVESHDEQLCEEIAEDLADQKSMAREAKYERRREAAFERRGDVA